MRNILLTLLLIYFTVAFCACEKDNFDGPDAVFFGELRDKKTGELIPQEISDGSRVYFIELGWAGNPTVQNTVIKKDGTFYNNMFFSGNYYLIMNRGNYVPLDTIEYHIKKGKNFYAFEVNPYLRILDSDISLNGRNIVAKFRLEQVTSNQVYRISLFAHSHIDVSSNLCIVNKTVELNRNVSESENFELSINLDDYSSTLISGKSYYFRIGAQSHGNETKYNYVDAVRITIP